MNPGTKLKATAVYIIIAATLSLLNTENIILSNGVMHHSHWRSLGIMINKTIPKSMPTIVKTTKPNSKPKYSINFTAIGFNSLPSLFFKIYQVVNESIRRDAIQAIASLTLSPKSKANPTQVK